MGYTTALFICLAILGAILLTGASGRSANETAFFDRVSSKEIQGVLAVFIMFHQIVVGLDAAGDYAGDMRFFFYYGILAVAFFLSVG